VHLSGNRNWRCINSRKEIGGISIKGKEGNSASISETKSWRCINLRRKSWRCINFRTKRLTVHEFWKKKVDGVLLCVQKSWRCFRLGPALQFCWGPNFRNSTTLENSSDFSEWRESRFSRSKSTLLPNFFLQLWRFCFAEIFAVIKCTKIAMCALYLSEEWTKPSRQGAPSCLQGRGRALSLWVSWYQHGQQPDTIWDPPDRAIHLRARHQGLTSSASPQHIPPRPSKNTPELHQHLYTNPKGLGTNSNLLRSAGWHFHSSSRWRLGYHQCVFFWFVKKPAPQ